MKRNTITPSATSAILAQEPAKASSGARVSSERKQRHGDSFVGLVKKTLAAGLICYLSAPKSALAVDGTRLPAAWLRGKYLTPRNATDVDEKNLWPWGSTWWTTTTAAPAARPG